MANEWPRGTQDIKSAYVRIRPLANKPFYLQIKNAMTCAASIVRASKEPLTCCLLIDILESLVDGFDDDDACAVSLL